MRLTVLVLAFVLSLGFIGFELSQNLNNIEQQPSVAGASTLNFLPIGDQFIDTVNKTRVDNNQLSLSFDDELMRVASIRVEDMINRNYYSHENPDGITYNAYLQSSRQYSCENLNLSESNQAPDIVLDWMISSSGHRECLLDERVSTIGYAVSELQGSTLTVLIIAD